MKLTPGDEASPTATSYFLESVERGDSRKISVFKPLHLEAKLNNTEEVECKHIKKSAQAGFEISRIMLLWLFKGSEFLNFAFSDFEIRRKES